MRVKIAPQPKAFQKRNFQLRLDYSQNVFLLYEFPMLPTSRRYRLRHAVFPRLQFVSGHICKGFWRDAADRDTGHDANSVRDVDGPFRSKLNVRNPGFKAATALKPNTRLQTSGREAARMILTCHPLTTRHANTETKTIRAAIIPSDRNGAFLPSFKNHWANRAASRSEFNARATSTLMANRGSHRCTMKAGIVRFQLALRLWNDCQ